MIQLVYDLFFRTLQVKNRTVFSRRNSFTWCEIKFLQGLLGSIGRKSECVEVYLVHETGRRRREPTVNISNQTPMYMQHSHQLHLPT